MITAYHVQTSYFYTALSSNQVCWFYICIFLPEQHLLTIVLNSFHHYTLPSKSPFRLLITHLNQPQNQAAWPWALRALLVCGLTYPKWRPNLPSPWGTLKHYFSYLHVSVYILGEAGDWWDAGTDETLRFHFTVSLCRQLSYIRGKLKPPNSTHILFIFIWQKICA